MEAAVLRGGTVSAVPPQPPPGKEWRAVTEDSEHVKLRQSDERTIFEQRAGTLDVNFCSIAVGGVALSEELLQQRIDDVSRQREQLQHLEIELKARAIARSEIIEMQNSFNLQIKEHADDASRLKEQLQERDQHIRDLELKLEEKDRELRAVQRDNEAAWAKEEATLRRERDNSESERAQHLQQIHDLQERIREQENQCVAVQEQCRAAQDSIIYKDEQLREAQTWIARVQEMGTMQTTTSQSLQAELRERIEQFNQYYIGFQRQFMEMERHHLQAIQQLQVELAEARERNGVSSESSQGAQGKFVDASTQGNEENQINFCFSSTSNGNSGCDANGSSDGAASFVSSANSFTKIEQAPSVPLLPPSILGIGSFLPHGQVASLHPYIIQSQTVQPVPSMNSPVTLSHVGHGLQVPQVPGQQHWQSQQGIFDASQMPFDHMNQLSQTEQNLLRSDAHYGFEGPTERHVASDHINNDINRHISDPVMNGANEKFQGFESNGKNYLAQQESQEKLTTDSRFHGKLAFDKPSDKSEINHESIASMINQSEKQPLTFGQQWSCSDATVSASEISSINSDNSSDHNVNVTRENDISVSVLRVSSLVKHGKAMEPTLLDERAILACIVRAIPAGSGNGIRISTTLTNRLAKMLAPLHWHDYKKRYGRLDEFVGHHQELFVIDGDFIRLHEGAHEIIAATTAVAKVAAAASSATFLPSVAVTPVAQISRHNKAPSADSRARNGVQYTKNSAASAGGLTGKHSQTSKAAIRSDSVSFDIVQGMCDAKTTNTRDVPEANALENEIRSSHAPFHVTSGNGQKLDGAGPASSDGKDLTSGRQGVGGRRLAAAGAIYRRS